jgi:hypothetical protein
MSPRPVSFVRWVLALSAAAAFLFGFAAGQALDIGSTALFWAAIILGVAVWAAPLLQAYTDYQMLQLERARDHATYTGAELSRQQIQTDLSAMSEQVYERASRFLRTMPEELTDTWFDWGNVFEGIGAAELRALFHALQRAAAAAGGESADLGRRAHSDFLALERTIHVIYSTTWAPRSPAELVSEALAFRGSIREALAGLGAAVDRSQPF